MIPAGQALAACGCLAARRVPLYESTNTLEYPAPEWDLLWHRFAEVLGLPKVVEAREQ